MNGSSARHAIYSHIKKKYAAKKQLFVCMIVTNTIGKKDKAYVPRKTHQYVNKSEFYSYSFDPHQRLQRSPSRKQNCAKHSTK